VVVGAGIAGLASGYALRTLGYDACSIAIAGCALREPA
jgi:protoporphyrinogen oxidase